MDEHTNHSTRIAEQLVLRHDERFEIHEKRTSSHRTASSPLFVVNSTRSSLAPRGEDGLGSALGWGSCDLVWEVPWSWSWLSVCVCVCRWV